MKTAIRKRHNVEIEMNLSKKSRTKGDIICYSDDEQVDELPFRTKGGIIGYGGGGEPVHNHQSMDKKVPTTKVKLLPATPLGLVKRFRNIYKVCPHVYTPIQNNEFVSILDEMYGQNVIGPIEYRQINNSIGESMAIDDSTDEENDENKGGEDDLLRIIKFNIQSHRSR